MKRRSVLGVLGTVSLTAVSGCVSTGLTGSEYETREFEGETVPLVPLEDAYEWFEAEEATFVDTRGEGQYETAHIEAALLSTAPDGLEDDPLEDVDHETRLVTYCDCPHSLAVQRGSRLLASGYEDVYAFDDGFPAWQDAGYPTGGDGETASIDTYDIVGESDPTYAGEYVWLSDTEKDRHEIAQIEADGRYELTLRFADLEPSSLLVLETPAYTLEATLEELTSAVVTAG